MATQTTLMDPATASQALVPLAQMEALTTQETEKTTQAFQEMTSQMRKALEVLAQQNTQLQNRVTTLETEKQQTEILLKASDKSTKELITAMREEFKQEVKRVEEVSKQKIEEEIKERKALDSKVASRISTIETYINSRAKIVVEKWLKTWDPNEMGP